MKDFFFNLKECFRLPSYQTKQQVGFILKYSFFSLGSTSNILKQGIVSDNGENKKIWVTNSQPSIQMISKIV